MTKIINEIVSKSEKEFKRYNKHLKMSKLYFVLCNKCCRIILADNK